MLDVFIDTCAFLVNVSLIPHRRTKKHPFHSLFLSLVLSLFLSLAKIWLLPLLHAHVHHDAVAIVRSRRAHVVVRDRAARPLLHITAVLGQNASDALWYRLQVLERKQGWTEKVFLDVVGRLLGAPLAQRVSRTVAFQLL